MGEPAPRAVLVREASWPVVPGVCCWRDSLHAALDAIALPMVEVDAPAQAAGADLVITETVPAAVAVVASGVPRQRVFALALPPEPLPLGARSSYQEELAHASQRIGGFVTDSELAREAVEQATAGCRPRVEVFPPLAVDRTCPICAASPYRSVAIGHPHPRQLAYWRSLVEQVRSGRSPRVPYSFPAVRLLGPARQWTPERHLGWRPGGAPSWGAAPPSGAPPSAAPQWSVAAQERGARQVWQAARPAVTARAGGAQVTLLAGFNLKFAVELVERLAARRDLDIAVDEWPSESVPTDRTGQLLAGARSILAEWARPSAAWLSRHKRPDQFLVLRLHRYELDSPHPRRIEIDNVDAVVFVSPRFGRRIRDELGWPVDKLVYIPNFLDVDWLDRPKLPEARFGIGMVGVESIRKRFDLALDLLAEVRRTDPRFVLFVRSVLPWDNPHSWRQEMEREYAGRWLARLEHDPLLRGAVVFDRPGRDMARWYRRVGHVLSTSDDESWHLAPAEGMASGAVPVIRPWPGAVEIYGIEWIHSSTEEAAAAVLANADAAGWAEQAARARSEIRRTQDPGAVVDAWADLLHGDLAAARSRFAGQVGQAAFEG